MSATLDPIDLIWNRIPEVRDGLDLNTIRDGRAILVQDPTNGPSTGKFYVFVYSTNADGQKYTFQKAYLITTGVYYYRIAAGGTWTAWETVVTGSAASVNPTPLVGVNATADTTDRLAVASPSSLFNHAGSGHTIKVNKAAAANTASVLFLDALSGRAEAGLTADDDFHLKVSADGSTWKEAIVVNRSSGAVSTPFTPRRELLTAARTYHVSPSGSDTTNNGLSAGAPFQTIAKAWAVVAGNLDLGGQTVTIQLADGTYAAGLNVQPSWVGGGDVVLMGNVASPSSVVINGSYGVLVQVPLPGTLTVRGVKLVNGATGLYHISTGTMKFADVDFGACGNFHVATEAPGAKIEASGNYAISGSSSIHWLANGQGLIVVAGKTVTITGTPAFSSMFAYATRLSQIQGYANTFSGSATGTRYFADGNSVIFTNGGGSTAYPGDSAGSTATGGQYV